MRPAFIPPNAPAPLIRMTSMRGIRRALPLLGWGVAHGHATMAQAVQAVTEAFLTRVWDGRKVPYAVKVRERIIKRLYDYARDFALLAEATAEDEGWRDDLAGMREDWDAALR